jgi:ferritin
MIKQSVQDAINEQIKEEFYSAFVYLSMSAYFESVSLAGLAHWMRVQYQEEEVHALRLFDYLNERGGTVELREIPQPPTGFNSPLQVMEQALNHERHVTTLIESLYEKAAKENDYATQAALQWFITEQVEEENNAGTIVEQLRMIGDNRAALLMLDMELGKRTPDVGE